MAKAINKSKHGVGGKCDTVKKVLELTPERGDVIPKRGGLRKMRVAVADIGKRSGYRLVYSARNIEGEWLVAMHRLYFKSDQVDLTDTEYKTVMTEDEAIWKAPLLWDFE